jgi:hypothetical protein
LAVTCSFLLRRKKIAKQRATKATKNKIPITMPAIAPLLSDLDGKACSVSGVTEEGATTDVTLLTWNNEHILACQRYEFKLTLT